MRIAKKGAPLVLVARLVAAPLAVFAQADALAPAEGTDEFFRLMAEERTAITVASPRPETVLNSVSNVSVIDREAIERHQFASVSEALESLPGVMLWRTFSRQRIPIFRGGLQEHFANKVLVMIDNVPAFSAHNGEGDLDRVSIDAVERIEVLRGPASVLYGTNALQGVVNIVLRKPGDSGRLGEATFGVGTTHRKESLDVKKAGGLYAWRGKGDGSYLLSADMTRQAFPTYRFSDGANQPVYFRDYHDTRSFSFKGDYKGHSLLVNVVRNDQSSFGSVITRASGLGFNEEQEKELVDYGHVWDAEAGRLRYSLTYDRQRRDFPRSSDDNLRADTWGYRLVNRLGFQPRLGGGWTLELGGDHAYSQVWQRLYQSRDDVTVEKDRPTAWDGSVHAQLGRDTESWRFLLGSRFTHHRAFGSDVSSRGSAVYRLTERDSVKLMLGQSYRAPSLVELYLKPTTPPVTVLGNPGLSPEKNRSVELAYLAARGNLYAQATLYYAEHVGNIFRNVGDFTRDGVTYANVNFYDNAGLIAVKGVETELKYRTSRESAFLSVDYVYGTKGDARRISPAAGETREVYNFKFVPRYTVSAGLSRELGGFSLSARVNHYSSMETLRTRLPANHWLDAGVAYRHGALRHVLALHNATDRHVDVPEYVRQRSVEAMPLRPGRELDYTVTWRF